MTVHFILARVLSDTDTERRTDTILTVGNVDRANLRRKGLEPFVRAAERLPRLHFVLAGAWLDGAIDDLRRIAPPNVTFAGRLSDDALAALFRAAAIYVQASAHEGFGLALAEAMGAGCAPVVTRVGALPEVVGDAGVYAASAGPDDLAAAIARALSARTTLGAAARARIAALFTLERRADGLAAVIDDSLRPTDTRPPVADRPDDSGDEASPLVSVVIPTRDEQATIAACLDAVLRQDYPAARMEVLVVDGRSTDRTRAIVGECAAADRAARVRLLDNPRAITPVALNIGIRAARGAIVARVDGHTIIAPDYLRRCVETLRATNADNVGGLMRPRGRGYAGECIALATGSRFGIGDSRFHYDETGGAADTVYLGCFRRAIFARVGLFDESLVHNQDDELNDRIVAAGGRVWLDPRIRSAYYNRASWRSLGRQYYGYGYWKVRVLRRHPHALRARHLAPAALVAGLGASAALAATLAVASHPRAPRRRPVRLLALALWGTYGVASLTAGCTVAARAGWRYLPGLLISFWRLHLSYGAGFLAALPTATRSDPTRIPRLQPSWDAASGTDGAPAKSAAPAP